jgi:hypothetical protein
VGLRNFLAFRVPAQNEEKIPSIPLRALDSPALIACEEFASAAIMRPSNKGENTMSKSPSHRAFVVTNSKGEGDQKGFWHEVGVVWPHKSGKGFDVVIHEGISVNGRIVCTEPKKTDDKQ